MDSEAFQTVADSARTTKAPARAVSIGVVFITHCAKQHLPNSLPPILASPLKPRTLVVNSSSDDGTVDLAKEMGAEVLVVPRNEFNHGATRELARRQIGTDIVVMMTPDAYAVSPEMLERLVGPLRTGAAAASYARQIPHKGAGFFEAFPREYNYPAESHIRSLQDLPLYGPRLYLTSDTCMAWSNSVLDEIGGFPPALVSEDAIVTAKLLKHGYRVAYVAEAIVHHSHRYTLLQEFRRYFDTGYGRRQMKSLTFEQREEAHGSKFARAMFTKLWDENPVLLPYAAAQIISKYVGYKLGTFGHRLPVRLRRALSAQDFYWNSIWIQ